jgi:hypothetical protein
MGKGLFPWHRLIGDEMTAMGEYRKARGDEVTQPYRLSGICRVNNLQQGSVLISVGGQAGRPGKTRNLADLPPL